MNDVSTQQDIGSEEYLQISSNIVSTFGSRLPVALCIHDAETQRVVPLFEKGVRLSDKKKTLVDEYCNAGNLFISRADYTGLAGHISKNLGTLLTEHYLDESSAAQIFYSGVLEKVKEFYKNPVGENLEEIKTVLAIFAEYVWIDQERWAYFFNTLKRENDIACHVVDTLFVGTAIYLKTVHKVGEKLDLSSLTLGLVLHDLGMTQLPKALANKQGPFIYKEKMRMQEHVDIAEKMINRLDIKDEIVKQCVLDHHERLDGSGYPKGRRGDAISIETRVVSIADAFCAMISERDHRNALNPILAAIILTESKKQYDTSLTMSLISFIIANNPEMKALLQDKKKMQQLRALAMQKISN